MSAKRKLDLDRTRERLLALGLTHAAESLDGVLTEAIKDDAVNGTRILIHLRHKSEIQN